MYRIILSLLILFSMQLSATLDSQDFTNIAEKSIPAVVSIEIRTKSSLHRSPYAKRRDHKREDSFDFFGDEFFNHFFGSPRREKEYDEDLNHYFNDHPHNYPRDGQGSGFLISDDGYILTNNHVIEDADMITVTLNDQREFEAKVIGHDKNTDIAVIKIEANNLPFLQMGSSSDLKIGQWVVAIGTPLGLKASLSVGVVSAKGRNNLNLSDFEDFIQTDAAINPGNSGGPLLNLKGEVIGINTAIATHTGGYMGIGFAIPSHIAKHIMHQILDSGSASRGFLGVTLQPIDKNLAEAFDLKNTKGALVADVVKNSSAEKAGLEQGDVILEYNQRVIDHMTTLRNLVSLTTPGQEVTLKVLKNKDIKEILLTIGEHPADQKKQKQLSYLGIEVETLTEELAKKLGYFSNEGVVIKSVDKKSLASMAGLRKGQLILSLNRVAVKDENGFYTQLKKVMENDNHLLMQIQDGQNKRFVSLRINP